MKTFLHTLWLIIASPILLADVPISFHLNDQVIATSSNVISLTIKCDINKGISQAQINELKERLRGSSSYESVKDMKPTPDTEGSTLNFVIENSIYSKVLSIAKSGAKEKLKIRIGDSFKYSINLEHSLRYGAINEKTCVIQVDSLSAPKEWKEIFHPNHPKIHYVTND